jgi:predicted NBD/HSP70 family sugar kinase
LDDTSAVGPGELAPDSSRRVLGLIDKDGPMTQTEVARRTGLSRAAVSNAVRRLRDQSELGTRTVVSNGRQANLVYRMTTDQLLLGLDIGHRHARVAISGPSMEILAERAEELDAGHTAKGSLDVVERLVDAVLDEVDAERPRVACAALGLPGPVDQQSGIVGSFSILPGWAGSSDRRAEFQNRLGVPVIVDNDANLGALGESVAGAARDCDSFAYVKVSHGVGAGLVLNGQVYRGPRGSAGEIGHITIDENGPVCECGNRGCLEIYAGADRILALLERIQGPPTIRAAVLAALDGDARSRRVLQDAGRHIGIGVATICLLLGPSLIVIGGELSTAGEILLDPLRQSVSRLAVAGAAQAMVVRAQLAERSEVVGALALASQWAFAERGKLANDFALPW